MRGKSTLLFLAAFTATMAQPSLIPYSPDTTNSITPTLTWNSVNGARDYRIEIDSTAGFVSPLVRTLVTGSTTYTTPSWNPLPAGAIFWHVSSNLDYAAFSVTDTFFINTAPQLNAYVPDPTPARKPTLTWNSVSGATAYTVQISRDSLFTATLIKAIVATPAYYSGSNITYQPSQDLPVGKIFWRVSSNRDTAVFSPYDQFVIDSTLPLIPTLIPYSPDTTNNTRPTLTWNSVNGVRDYRIEIDSTAGFVTPLVRTLVTGSTTYSIPSWNPLPAGRIFWHVSTNLDYTAFSVIDDFFINTAPQLIAYAPDSTPARRPTLMWNSVSGATGYIVQISRDSLFADILIKSSVTTSPYYSGTNTYQPSQNLPVGKVFWRVSSNRDTAAFSPYDQFVIDSTLQLIPTLIPYTPDTTNNIRPTLRWNAVNGAHDYRIEIDSSISFVSPLVRTLVTGSTTYATPYWNPLPSGRIYWHVSTNFDYAAFSIADDFFIDPNAIMAIKNLGTQFGPHSITILGISVPLPINTYRAIISVFDVKGKLVCRYQADPTTVLSQDRGTPMGSGIYVVSFCFQNKVGTIISNNTYRTSVHWR